MSKAKMTTRAIAYAAVSTALVTAFTLMGFSSAQFYFNLGDTIILLVSALCGPVVGAIAGGLGSFFADLAVYPMTMVYTLIIKGIEGFLCGFFLSLLRKKTSGKKRLILSGVVMLLSACEMVAGYFLCQSLFYGSVKTALIALPMDAVQGTVSFTLSFVILFLFKLDNVRERFDLDFQQYKAKKNPEKEDKES